MVVIDVVCEEVAVVAARVVGSAGDPVGDPVGQLSQAAGHWSMKCGMVHSMSRLSMVMVMQGSSGSGLPLHKALGLGALVWVRVGDGMVGALVVGLDVVGAEVGLADVGLAVVGGGGGVVGTAGTHDPQVIGHADRTFATLHRC